LELFKNDNTKQLYTSIEESVQFLKQHRRYLLKVGEQVQGIDYMKLLVNNISTDIQTFKERINTLIVEKYNSEMSKLNGIFEKELTSIINNKSYDKSVNEKDTQKTYRHQDDSSETETDDNY